MNTHRPDKTGCLHAEGTRHFLQEMNSVSYTRGRDTSSGSDMRTNAFPVALVNLNIGLPNNLNFQVLLETYSYVRVNDPSPAE